MTQVRVLGIDPGTRHMGFGIVERRGAHLALVDAGILNAAESKPLEERLCILFEGLSALIEEHRPTVVAVEDIFFAKHATAALKLGHARGIALLAAARAGLAVHPYPPALVKRTVAGNGRADKAQVARLVGAVLGLRDLPGEDATDAIAIAMTHLQASRLPALLAQAVRAPSRRGRKKSVGISETS